MTERVKISELKEGDVLVADGNFTCLDLDQECVVRSSARGTPDFKHLYVQCREGRHFLDGQLDADGDSLLSLTRKTS